MPWTDHLQQQHGFLGAPDLFDGHSRIAEAMGGLADDEYSPPNPAGIAAFASDLDDYDRVHEAICGLVRADDL